MKKAISEKRKKEAKAALIVSSVAVLFIMQLSILSTYAIFMPGNQNKWDIAVEVICGVFCYGIYALLLWGICELVEKGTGKFYLWAITFNILGYICPAILFMITEESSRPLLVICVIHFVTFIAIFSIKSKNKKTNKHLPKQIADMSPRARVITLLHAMASSRMAKRGEKEDKNN